MRRQRQRLKQAAILLACASAVVAGVAVISYQKFERDAARLPVTIREAITFSPFLIPVDSMQYEATDYKLSDVENNIQLLSYILTSKDGRVTVSEYPQPPQFTDIPEYKERFLANIIKQYATVQTASGTIYLGRQTKQDNKQLAIMIERGLIVLMNPQKDLTEQQWRVIGEQLEIQKIN